MLWQQLNKHQPQQLAEAALKDDPDCETDEEFSHPVSFSPNMMILSILGLSSLGKTDSRFLHIEFVFFSKLIFQLLQANKR